MIEDMIVNLKKYDVAEISYKTGVSIATVSNIIAKRNINPTISVVQKLQDFLEEKDSELS